MKNLTLAHGTQVLSTEAKQRLCENIAGNVCAAQRFLQERVIAQWGKVHPDCGKKISDLLDKHNVSEIIYILSLIKPLLLSLVYYL